MDGIQSLPRRRQRAFGTLLLMITAFVGLWATSTITNNAKPIKSQETQRQLSFQKNEDDPSRSKALPESPFLPRAPVTYGKMTEYSRDDEFGWIEVPPPETTTTETSNVEPAATVQEGDDFYESITVLDDEVPWDLTEDEGTTKDYETQLPKPTEPPHSRDEVDDYVVVFIDDGFGWDDEVVKDFAEDQFELIENANANATMEDDEILSVPTPIPTDTPTSTPTITPVPTITGKPTGQPSIATSLSPTTPYPSSLPTEGPSLQPSASPTLFCHDVESYRSPINGLSCRHHTKTNCLSWRFIGLNLTDLEHLVNSCPETCQIDCGSFSLFSAPVSFRISRVSGFMSLDDVDAFMGFSTSYLEDFVRAYIAEQQKMRKDMNAIAFDEETEAGEENVESLEQSSNAVDTNKDDFLNDDSVVNGRTILFEIDNAELTSQNIVEETSPALVGRTDSFNTRDGMVEDSYNGEERRVLLRQGRFLQDLQYQRAKQKPGAERIVKTGETLDVIFTYKGFSIGMNPESMSELLVRGIDSVDFTRELQKAGIDFFSDATISSANEPMIEEVENPLEEELVEEEDKGVSTFSAVISYLVPIVVIGFLMGSIVYHRCYKKGWRIPCIPRNQHHHMERTQIGGMTATPMNAGTTNSIAESSNEDEDNAYYNYDRKTSKATSLEPKKDGKVKVDPAEAQSEDGAGNSAFTRLIAALNLNLTLSKSKSSVEEDGINGDALHKNDDGGSTRSSSSNSEIEKRISKERRKSEDGIRVISSPIISPMSGESGGNDIVSVNSEGFNAYATVLPPMIVIDNIDGPDPEATTPVMTAAGTTNKGIVDSSSFRSSFRSNSTSSQIDDLDACASEFRKQLIKSASKQDMNSGSIYDPFTRSSLSVPPDRKYFFGGQEIDDENRKIVDTVSEDWDGDDLLYPPIPSNITAEGGNSETETTMPTRKRTSSCGDIDVTPSQDQDVLDIVSPKPRAYGTWDGNPTASSEKDADVSSLSLPAVMHKSVISSDTLPPQPRRGSLPPKRPPTPEREHKKSVFARSPSAFSFRALMGGALSSGSSVDSGGHNRKSSGDTDDLRVPSTHSNTSIQSDDLVDSRSYNSSSKMNQRGGHQRLEFEAPREGNWGLVLESSSKTGPRIYAVKDYSPLFGLIQKGDKLLEIDGKNVSESNLTEVTKLLKGSKPPSYPYHRSSGSPTTMPIVVSRKSSPNNSASAAPVVGSFAYNTSSSSKDRHHRYQQQHHANSNYNHRRNNSYGSAGSDGSRVFQDVDNTASSASPHHMNSRHRSFYTAEKHPQEVNRHHHHQFYHEPYSSSQHSSFEYDSSNEI